jgi:hypothetical protein
VPGGGPDGTAQSAGGVAASTGAQTVSGSRSDGEGASDRTDLPKSRLSPAESLKNAIGLRDSARRAAQSGKFGQAFSDARDAWEAVRGQTDDPQCRSLEKKLLEEMDGYAQQANVGKNSAGAGILGKRLIVN